MCEREALSTNDNSKESQALKSETFWLSMMTISCTKMLFVNWGKIMDSSPYAIAN